MNKLKTAPKKILVARPDRLGDVILSTPVLRALKTEFPDTQVGLLVRGFAQPLLKGLKTVDSILVYDPEGRHQGWKGVQTLKSEIQAHGFDWAVVLQDQWPVTAAVRMAGIPNRVGPLSKPWSYLAFNHGIRQHRSDASQNEADYNLDLLAPLGISETRPKPEVYLSPIRKQDARMFLINSGWHEHEPLVVVHPGMGGSALNWNEVSYIQLVEKLHDAGACVMLTAGTEEQDILNRFSQRLEHRAIYYGGKRAQGLDVFAGVLSFADVVVAPSTGPLHLAHALGKPVVGIYPPIQVQSIKRWGPYQAEGSSVAPKVNCPEKYRCAGESCAFYYCMDHIGVNEVFDRVMSQLEKSERLNPSKETRAPEVSGVITNV